MFLTSANAQDPKATAEYSRKTEKKSSCRTRRLLEIIDLLSKGAMATNLGDLHLILLYVDGLNSLLLHVAGFILKN